ncbi:hypothetical protein DFH07DRAFT_952225 [Mycena maculata]|uniref:RING-type domain-containing protein n=1 Tax=Mycena maculata TaxID=230809 RepID=A0AAD7NTQ6_9AGAR|nr:hypothetical protein DFH07DRAFT_952225 [Mycena maculata]
MAWVPKPPPFTVYRRGNTTDTAGSRTLARRVRRMEAQIQNCPPHHGREILTTVVSPTLTIRHYTPLATTASATTYAPPPGPPPADDEVDNSLAAIRSRIAQLEAGSSWLTAPAEIYPLRREAREAQWARDRTRERQARLLANREHEARDFLPFIRRANGRRTRMVRGWPGASRRDRDRPLTETDLLINGEAPPEQLPKKPHHKCSICHLVKSHPVSYICGHSHCYVCIHLWLEHKWTCPDCTTPMYRPPFRQYGEEDWIAQEYPKWKDRSQVDYSWDGLVFPTPVPPPITALALE